MVRDAAVRRPDAAEQRNGLDVLRQGASLEGRIGCGHRHQFDGKLFDFRT